MPLYFSTGPTVCPIPTNDGNFLVSRLTCFSLLVANARIEGLEKGLNFPPTGFNTALWIFYIPFVLIEVPSNIIMSIQSVKPNLYLGAMVIILGLISTCQGLAKSYNGFLAIRFFMGIFEATLPAGMFVEAQTAVTWLM
jgi:hypothetical protein